MSDPLRVVLYLNQFFAGVGGEDCADTGPQAHEGAPGVALALQREMGDAAKVVATVFCGDSTMATGAGAGQAIVDLIRPYKPDVVVAGPAFGAGRYGLACGLVCAKVQEQLGVPGVTAMFEENPAVEMYRAKAIIVPTHQTAKGMEDALSRLARFALKLGQGETLGVPEEDGYFPQGYRRNEFVDQRASTRAVEMLLRKLKGQPFRTEWPVPRYEVVDPPTPLSKSDPIHLAMITTSGLVPSGNPDGLPSAWATQWFKYDIKGVVALTAEGYETIHGGYDTTLANENPNRIVPIDALRDLEEAGKIELHPQLYATTGNMGSIADMRRMGREIASELSSAGVDAVLVGAT